jgi:hypothetical protein
MIKRPIAKAFSEIFVLPALFSAKFVYKRGNDRVMILVIVARFLKHMARRRTFGDIVWIFKRGALRRGAVGMVGLHLG